LHGNISISTNNTVNHGFLLSERKQNIATGSIDLGTDVPKEFKIYKMKIDHYTIVPHSNYTEKE
jgi:hypothetical protein